MIKATEIMAAKMKTTKVKTTDFQKKNLMTL